MTNTKKRSGVRSSRTKALSPGFTICVAQTGHNRDRKSILIVFAPFVMITSGASTFTGLRRTG